MMKVINVQVTICLVILFLFANNAWAANWILFSTSNRGTSYYDKSSIKKVNKSIIRIWVKSIYNEKEKTKVFSLLKKKAKAPDNPDILSHDVSLFELDCVNEKTRLKHNTFYDEKDDVLYSQSNIIDEWTDILPDSTADELKNIVCKDSKTSKTKKK